MKQPALQAPLEQNWEPLQEVPSVMLLQAVVLVAGVQT